MWRRFNERGEEEACTPERTLAAAGRSQRRRQRWRVRLGESLSVDLDLLH